jgi:hypothetical protein
MVLQNKSDNSNGYALKWSNFRLNLSFWRCLSQKGTHFRENYLGNENFRENLCENENFCENLCENENFRETKFHENVLISASFSLFAKMEKPVLVSTLLPACLLCVCFLASVSPPASWNLVRTITPLKSLQLGQWPQGNRFGGVNDPAKTNIVNFLGYTRSYAKRLQAVNQGPRWSWLMKTWGSKISWHCPFKDEIPNASWHSGRTTNKSNRVQITHTLPS